MPFSIKPGRPIHSELQRVVRLQLKLARSHLEGGTAADLHRARKGVKKVRAIVVLLREANSTGLHKDDHRLRAVGRMLSELRDADAVLDTLSRVSRAAGPRVADRARSALRRDLARARARVVANAIDDESVARAADRLRALRRSAADWEVPAIEPIDIPKLVTVAYRTARKAMRRAEATRRASDLHEWRKGVKALWYELRLLEAWSPALRLTIRDLSRLEALLGEHQDLVVLTSAIAGARPRGAARDRNPLTHAIEQQQDALRQKAMTLGGRTLADTPKVFARTLGDALAGAGPAGRAAHGVGAHRHAGHRLASAR